MRRKDREVTEWASLLQIIHRCKVLRLGMMGAEYPYVVPLNFGYQEENGKLMLCFHCANEGEKLRRLRENPRVCFEMDGAHQLTGEGIACNYGYNFESVIGFGTVEFAESAEEKARLLTVLMKHQTGEEMSVTSAQAAAVTVCKILVDSLTGKARNG